MNFYNSIQARLKIPVITISDIRLEKGHGNFSGITTGHFGKLEGLRMLKKLVSLIPLRGARGPLRSTLLIYMLFILGRYSNTKSIYWTRIVVVLKPDSKLNSNLSLFTTI